LKDGVTCREKVLVRGKDYSCSSDGLEMMTTGYLKGVRDSVGTLADSETRTFMKARDNSLVLRIVYSKIDVLLVEFLAIPVGHGKAVWYRYETAEGATKIPK